MDEADIAQALIEREFERLLRHRLPEGAAATGVCLWCGEPLGQGLRWCDADCRDEWERAYGRRA